MSIGDKPPSDVKVVLFSGTVVPQATIQRMRACFEAQFHSDITVSSGGGAYAHSFLGATGLNASAPPTVETVFQVASPPDYLFIDTRSGDARLTVLEGNVALALQRTGVSGVSLIDGPHGVYDEHNHTFYVGLSYPAVAKPVSHSRLLAYTRALNG